MDRKLMGLAMILLATVGCQACSNSCDYLPPVANGPYQSISGQAISNSDLQETEFTEMTLPEVNAPDAPITPLPAL